MGALVPAIHQSAWWLDAVGGSVCGGVTAHRARFRDLVTAVWIPLSTALNLVNHSMGESDLYPFVLPEPVLDKLEFVASLRPA